MIRAEAPLPSLPLWLATLVALGTEAAMVAGLAHWPARPDPPSAEAPIEVSLVSVAALADSAAAGTVGGPRDPESADSEPVVTPPAESEPAEPESKPAPPTPRLVQPPDPTPVPVAAAQPKPKTTPKPKPKPPAKAKPPRPKSSPPSRAAPPKVSAKPADLGRIQASGKSATTGAGSDTGVGGGSASAAKGRAGTGDQSPAAYLNNPAPGYPDAARRQRQEGTVSLRVLVSASGQASQVLIAGSSGVSSLDEAAQRAVRRWRFKPAHQNGRPISAWVRVPVRFKLDR